MHRTPVHGVSHPDSRFTLGRDEPMTTYRRIMARIGYTIGYTIGMVTR